MNLSDFKCDLCGECCKHLDVIDFVKDMHTGGICKHLKIKQISTDVKTKTGNNAIYICSIYDDRPWFCNSRQVFARINRHISEEDFAEITIQACNRLKKLAKAK